jgi:hypothetical protein
VGKNGGEAGKGPGLEGIPKPLAIGLSVIYFFGFLVVTCHLTRYGVSSISLLKLQYLVAGVWLLAPLAGLWVFLAGIVSPGPSLFAERKFEFPVTNPPQDIFERLQQFSKEMLIPQGVRGYLLELFGLAIMFVPIVLASIVIAAFGFGSLNAASSFMGTFFRFHNLLIWVAFFAGIAITAGLAINALSRTEEEEKAARKWKTDGFAFYMATLCALILLWYVFYFARNWYPLIPYSLGGGKPLSVVFLLKTEEGHKELPVVPDSSGHRSIPYKMLLATEKTFVVLSPKKEEQAIEFERDAVLGMVVLNGPEEPEIIQPKK